MDLFELFTNYPYWFIAFVFLIGLMIGSFLNVVIYRLPVMLENDWKTEYQSYFGEEQSAETPKEKTTFNLVKPDSTCPKCGHKIRAWENIPIISWVILKAKCSQCRTPISWRYPAVELLTGVLSALIAWHFGFSTPCLAALVFTWCLIALTFIDADTMLLPDQITLPLLWLGLLLSIGNYFVTPQEAILGAAAGYLSLWSLYWGFKLLTGKEGMGYGDFKLLAALGAWLGWAQLPTVIILSSFVGAVLGILMLSIQGKEKSQPIPFGPYLAVAGFIAFLYGDQITAAYWQYLVYRS